MAVSHGTKNSSSTPLFIWFLQIIIVLVFCCYVIRLCLNPRAPIYTITNLYIPSTKGGNNFDLEDHIEINQNSTIIVTLVISNPNKAKGILYDETKISMYKNGSFLGGKSMPRFYQDGSKSLSSQVLVNVEQHKLKVGDMSENGIVKVGVETNVRYKILAWTTKKHVLKVEAFVPVDKGGQLMLGEEGVKLKPIEKFGL